MPSALVTVLAIVGFYATVCGFHLALVALLRVVGAVYGASYLAGLFPLVHLGVLIVCAVALLGASAYAWVEWYRDRTKSD
jgi:hypothetical protein